GLLGTDTVTVNGTSGNDVISVKNGLVTRGSPVVETVSYAGVESAAVHGGAGNDTLTDPDSTNLALFRDAGDDTITVANTTGPVAADGGDGSDTYVIQAGSLQGPVTISDTGATGTDAVTINGTAGADAITQSGNQVVADGGTVTLAAGVEAL